MEEEQDEGDRFESFICGEHQLTSRERKILATKDELVFRTTVRNKMCHKCNKDLGWGDNCPEYKGNIYCEGCMDEIIKSSGEMFIRFHVPYFCSGGTSKVYAWKGSERFFKDLGWNKDEMALYIKKWHDGSVEYDLMEVKWISGTTILRKWGVSGYILDKRIVDDMTRDGWSIVTDADFEESNRYSPALEAFDYVKDKPECLRMLKRLICEKEAELCQQKR